MHHIALDGAWPHNGNLNDEIVKTLWLETRQHRLLRAAFHLKYTYGIGAGQHLVNGCVFARYGGGPEVEAVIFAQKLEAFRKAGEHPERQHIHLQHAKRFDIVLVPGHDRTLFHSCILDGNELVEPSTRDKKAAGMLRKMTWKSDQLPG